MFWRLLGRALRDADGYGYRGVAVGVANLHQIRMILAAFFVTIWPFSSDSCAIMY